MELLRTGGCVAIIKSYANVMRWHKKKKHNIKTKQVLEESLQAELYKWAYNKWRKVTLIDYWLFGQLP